VIFMPPYGCRNTVSAHATQGVFINQTAEPIAIAAGPPLADGMACGVPELVQSA